MRTEIIQFTGANSAILPGCLWMPEGEVTAVLQIAHGMTEHMGRYAPLATYMTARGIAVAGFDLRGHGQNPGDPACASFTEGDWDASLEDMHRVYVELHRRFPEIPHFMLGFSLGSFLLREYLGRYDDEIAGAAILGTGHQPGAVLAIMTAIVKTQVKKAGFERTTPLVKKLSFETYNQKFAPNRTASDWLCSDDVQLDAYLADPLSRADISAGLFWQLLCAMKRTGSSSACENWNKELPILLLSGQNDPVGDFGKGVTRVQNTMQKAGVKHISMELYPGARHDLLHEECSGCAEKVRQCLLEWILKETANP